MMEENRKEGDVVVVRWNLARSKADLCWNSERREVSQAKARAEMAEDSDVILSEMYSVDVLRRCTP
jgi:hypothetical protein